MSDHYEQRKSSQTIPYCASESTSDLLEDSLTCPLCIELFDTNLESFAQAQERQAQRIFGIARRPLLSSEARLPVSCTSCWYTFCNACLHRLMKRPGGIKCPICPNTTLNVAAPSINIPLMRLMRLIRPMVDETPSTAAARPVVTPVKEKTKTATKAKKTKAKTKSKAKQSNTGIQEHEFLTGTVYQVEAIVGRRYLNQQIEYKVRWEGFQDQDTWEVASNLSHLDFEFRQQMEYLDEQARREGVR